MSTLAQKVASSTKDGMDVKIFRIFLKHSLKTFLADVEFIFLFCAFLPDLVETFPLFGEL